MRTASVLGSALLLVVAVTAPAVRAQGAGAPSPPGQGALPPPPTRETVVRAEHPEDAPEERATSTVRRADLERRLPRSAPDALRFEPGVFVQQTAHGQGSAFVRGLTGQQTLLVFDGVRLNTSTWRQGPNQYFFTLDAATIERIDVVRGGGSTRWGSDALGGVILTTPVGPRAQAHDGLRPRVALRGASADRERGGRVQLEGHALDGALGFLGGVGLRRVGRLEAAGPVLNPLDGKRPEVPLFAPDGRTQLGTGFDEATADARLVWRAAGRGQATLAAYAYRQEDAPRTDLCPPPSGRSDECLRFLDQDRTLVYAGWDGEGEGAARVRVWWQNQHERRRGERPASFVVSSGVDDVDTLGASIALPGPALSVAGRPLALAYGADAALDRVRSRASLAFTDIDVEVARSRGQYLTGSRYLTGGLYAQGALPLGAAVRVRAGARASLSAAHAPGDAESGSLAVERTWAAPAGHAGLAWEAAPWLTVLGGVDHSFRAPNLDDLTSRQQTGPGFQFENPGLAPERATTLEVGGRARTRRVSAEAWAFQTLLHGAVGKRPREAADCPPQTPGCATAWTRYQLVNARGRSQLRGLEGALRLRLPHGLSLVGGAAWTWGEGPNLADRPSDPALPYAERVPLSRVPPLHGTLELAWRPAAVPGLSTGAALRWARAQTRLAVADRSDARIPLGGTPGFAVADARVGWRSDALAVALVLENLLDTPYRYHGSSVNGPARSVTVQLEAGLP